jgi:hypothetical protein
MELLHFVGKKFLKSEISLYNIFMPFGTFLMLSFSLCLRFITRIAFTTLIGYYIDKFLGTFPCVMIVSIMIGGYLSWFSLIKVEIKKKPND